MIMRNLIVYFFLFAVFTSFTNGVRTAKLSCKSASGRTLFEAELEDMTSLNYAKFTVDKDVINFKDGDRCAVIFDPANKVLTIYLESESGFAEFWAIPASFKEVQNEGRAGDTYKFSASIRAKDPRKNKEYSTPVIALECTLNYYEP